MFLYINFRMIFGWIFDAASQHRCKMLENVNMPKHCACAVFWRIYMFGAWTMFSICLRSPMQNGSKNRQDLGTDCGSILVTRINRNLSHNRRKINEKIYRKSNQKIATPTYQINTQNCPKCAPKRPPGTPKLHQKLRRPLTETTSATPRVWKWASGSYR